MAGKRGYKWEADSLSPEQVLGVILLCDIEVHSQTEDSYLCLCPFHANSDTPALSVDKVKGIYMCFNPDCGESGTLNQLAYRTKGLGKFAVKRELAKLEQDFDLQEVVRANLEPKPIEPFDQDYLDYLKGQFDGSPGDYYLRHRGFKVTTMAHFDLGWSKNLQMVCVPMHDDKGMPVGMVRRSIHDKEFRNTKHLPKAHYPWNYHRAKKCGGTVVICESTFDAMRIHQSGYPGVVALLGGYISDAHVQLLGRTFDRVVIMTDYDEPGRKLGRSIATALSHRDIYWACYDDTAVYPKGCKDATDMTDDQIRQCLRNAIPHHEYLLWGIDS